MKKGINLFGYFPYAFGIAQGARNMGHALKQSDIKSTLVCAHLPNTKQTDTSLINYYVKSAEDIKFNTNIFFMNARDLLNTDFGDIKNNRYNIGFWNWELNEFPKDFIPALDLVDEVWVPSNFTKDSLDRLNKKPIKTIPIPVIVRPDLSITRESIGIPASAFAFYTMFDFNSAVERKNPEGVIKAFKKSFDKDSQEVILIIKMSSSFVNNRLEYNKVIAEIGDSSNIYVIDQELSKDEVDTIVNLCDCFVSLHRAEGYGLGPAEAMAMGKPVIATNWSSTTDFMNHKNSMLVDYDLIKVYGQMFTDLLKQSHQVWADPDIDHAAYYMQKIVADDSYRKSLAFEAKDTIEKFFSERPVVDKIKNRLGKLSLL